jgi:hypothetical protein
MILTATTSLVSFLVAFTTTEKPPLPSSSPKSYSSFIDFFSLTIGTTSAGFCSAAPDGYSNFTLTEATPGVFFFRFFTQVIGINDNVRIL